MVLSMLARLKFTGNVNQLADWQTSKEIGSQTLIQSLILKIHLINYCDKMRKMIPVSTNAGVLEAQNVAKPGVKGTWLTGFH